MAAFGAVRVTAKKDVYLDRLRNVAVFRKGPSTIQIGRFHTPPVIADLDALTLEDGDFDAARKCKPGDCDLKLARSALDRIQKEMDWKAPDARARATQLTKQMLVEYVSAYLRGGTAEMATYVDNAAPLETAAEFRKVLAASPYLVSTGPPCSATSRTIRKASSRERKTSSTGRRRSSGPSRRWRSTT